MNHMKKLYEELLSENDNEPVTIELYEKLIDTAKKYVTNRALPEENGYRLYLESVNLTKIDCSIFYWIVVIELFFMIIL